MVRLVATFLDDIEIPLIENRELTKSKLNRKGIKLDWKNQTVLVTGAGGFIGSHLVERLVSLGAQTRALVHYNSAGARGWLDSSPVSKDIQMIPGDICDSGSLRQAFAGTDIVFHLAALIAIPYSYQAPLHYVRTNIEGTLNVLQSALDSGAQRVVVTSSSEVYGTAQYVPIDEGHPLQGQSPYSATKIGAEKLAEAFHLSYGLPIATIRPFNTYGPRQSTRAVIPTIITQALDQDEIRLGRLEPIRDFNYVADTVDGFIAMAECPEASGQVINIGSGREISIRDLARKIMELIGRDIPITQTDERVRPEGSEVDRLCASNAKANDILGWQPQHTLEQGLTETIEWFKDNRDLFQPGTYTI